ncbi:hypothetical protein E2562_003773 [Oryza meyeriana var. granulata]|uniref:Uncharacterized protein n=1 Tax=Oryza meyeriana var. granulata TaxID=110450 RepID=A0A6G1BS25_9ORYZ|nr:hypothetical protein E2562_003773 [Oryza meyeriana var. granulata]
MRACLREALACGGSFGQWEVIFFRRSTATSCRTLGVLAVRRWWTSPGTTYGSPASRQICPSACRRASLSGIRNWIRRSSSDCAIPPCHGFLPTLLQSAGAGDGVEGVPRVGKCPQTVLRLCVSSLQFHYPGQTFQNNRTKQCSISEFPDELIQSEGEHEFQTPKPVQAI